jgi:hypothetical protein
MIRCRRRDKQNDRSCWHICDMPRCPTRVRYALKSRLSAAVQESPRPGAECHREARGLARCRPGAGDQAAAGRRQHHAARPGRWPECGGHYNSTRWQLGPDASAAALGSDLSGEGRDERVNRPVGAGYAPFLSVEENSKASAKSRQNFRVEKFLLLFPPIALAVFTAPEPSKPSMGCGVAYTIAVIPARLMAGGDWVF